MKELSLDEMKAVEAGILQHFDKYCKAKGLRYSLAEGTLIGAARHKGFIPWDDDIDVIMPREDFEKFRASYQDERFQIIQPSKDSCFPYFYIRLSDNKTTVKFEGEYADAKVNYYEGGLWIDILPIDNFPDSDEELRKTERKLLLLFKMYRAQKRRGWCKQHSFARNMAWVLTKAISYPIPTEWMRKKLEKMMVQYNNEETKRKGFWTNYWHHPWIFPARVFDGYTELEFEGQKFPVIAGYDEYLRSEYGDYMKLPPKEKQIAQHDFKSYYI